MVFIAKKKHKGGEGKGGIPWEITPAKHGTMAEETKYSGQVWIFPFC